MTPQEESMLNDLVGRVEQTQLTEKDPEAERLLEQRLGPNPNALYILAQTVLVQKYALEQAQAQINQLRQQAPPPPARATSFLGNLLGHHDPAPPPPLPPPPAPGYGAPGGPGPREGYGSDFRERCAGVHHEAEELRHRLEREGDPADRARIEGRLRELHEQEERCR